MILPHLSELAEGLTRTLEISVYDQKIKDKNVKNGETNGEIIGEETDSKIDVLYHPTFVGEVVGKKFTIRKLEIESTTNIEHYLLIEGSYVQNNEVHAVEESFLVSEHLHCQIDIGDCFPDIISKIN